MTTKDEALKLALEALEELNNTNSYWWQEVDEATIKKIDPAITAIKQTLAAPVQEPVNWSVYNSGAEVASGLTFSEAWDYLTPERLARQWCAVCVVDQSSMPATPPAAHPAPMQEQAEQLAKLGWQAIECPFCGSSGAQAFPKPAAQSSYDQAALELCITCGWKTLIPGDGCLNCERETVAFAKDKSESAYQRGYMDGMAKGRRDAATDAAEKQKTNYLNGYCTGRTELLAEQAKQNPVAWMVYTLDGTSVCVTDNPEDFTNEHRALPLYAYPEPAKQPAVPLTNGEIYTAYITATNQTLRPQDERLALAFARAIEAKLKEKNNGM